MNSLISAVDNHNVANGDPSWLEQRMDATGTVLGKVGGALTYGSVGSVVAGVNSILNSGIAVANFLGADIEPINTYNVLKTMDDDLGQYYRQHETGVETAGFILGAFAPGTAGVKALQAAKAGFLGTNMAKSSGLMTSLTKDYATMAKMEFAAGTSPFTLMNQNVIKALGQGFGSAALEATAFELAVAGTMFKSPVLEEMNSFNIANNIAVGTLIGGGLGGILHGIGTVYGIKKSMANTKAELYKYQHITEFGDLPTSDLKLINYFQQKINLPEAALDAGFSSELDDVTRLALITKERTKTAERLDILIKQEFNSYAGGDELIGRQLYERFKDTKDLNGVVAALINSKGAQRITANERLEVGDVLFPTHGLKKDEFNDILAKGETNKFFTDQATAGTQGFRIIGDIKQLKIAGYGTKTDAGFFGNKDSAFAAGYDLFRNSNGTFAIHPESKILKASNERRVPNNLIVDFEQGGAIVSKATPGLADLATRTKPVSVKGNVVLAGDLNPFVIKDTGFHPMNNDYLEIQARYIWAQEQKNIKWKDKIVHENDLPLLERAYYDADKAEGFIVRFENGKSTRAPTGEKLREFIALKKQEFAQQMGTKPVDELAIRLNVSEKWLMGEADEIGKLRPGVDYNLPRYARVDYPDSILAMDQYNAAHIDGMVQYEHQINIIKQRHLQNTNNYLAGTGIDLPDAPNFSDPGRMPTGQAAGAGFWGFANSNFGSIGGWAQYVGSLTNRLKIHMKTKTVEELNNVAAAVNTSELRSELDLVVNKLRSMPDAYVFHPANPNKIIPRKDYSTVLAGAKPSDEIAMSGPIADFLKVHSGINARRQVHVKNIKSTAGVMDDVDLNVVYPPPIDTSKYKHFVLVEPKTITLGDKKHAIVAKDQATLEKLISQVDQNQYKIWTKTDKEEFHKAAGDYDFALGLNESLVDSSLKRSGVLRDHFAGNPSQRILDDFLDWHVKQEEILATRMVEHRYSQSFQELRRLGESHTNLATSQFRSLTDALVESVNNPYNDVVKTALDISRAGEYKWWRSFNETVKEAIELPGRQLGQLFAKTEKVDDKFVAEVNSKSAALGMGTPYKDAYTALVASQNIADKPFLARYIAKAQALMSTTLLQLDWFNAVNNIISTPILLSSQTNTLITAIKNSNPEIAGKLAAMMSVKTPEGAQAITLPSTTKLIANALRNYHRDVPDKLGLLERFERINAVTDVLQQERQMFGEMVVDFGTLTASQAESKINRAVEFGKKITGNKLAEQMTRFVAADVMRQITDLALQAGVLRNVREADEYIQLFVNKVQGNYLHSQRPIVFQGVVGQAISLFQTYQFNLMQQLFKHVGEGDKKSIAILLGLQGSIYGMQGLPAFNFVNTHIVGNASGNTQHRDLHYAANSVFGKELGDWLIYGAGSNALGLIDPRMKINIYSRGDINPRQLTVLPTNIEDVPVVAASVRFLRNIWTAVERTGNGAAMWPTISQAIEHNGLSRPLTGLAQIAQGYTTTNQGSLLSGSQDFWNIASVSRIFGGKPFDEAIALDALYRVNAYRAADLSRIQDVGSALKTSLIAGRDPTEDEVNTFAAKYAKAGGRIENFNRFMTGQMLAANRSQVNALAFSLNSPFAHQMQMIMGGVPVPDFMTIR